ncbi:YtkA-like [Paracoccus halophilus]|uniref:YtkA-like n=1 Tax=Paracoccus halophilus TaxID=376733 RepID=A0A099EYX6_9RHOB|nr:FixH family protein [Paracoccus halophilus]KGJ03173.1 hypothetical protein IT41_15210 [Paracoccus halophilus]SFA59216.1 YtkA-like [Paracoccus halophilus]
MFLRRLAALALAAFATAALAQDAAPLTATSDAGLYRAELLPEAMPIPINIMQAWTLTLTDAAGIPVEGARIAITGGMPAHGHGLPTAPGVTADLGDGRYRIEGLHFSMTGVWALGFGVMASPGADRIIFRFDI